MCDSTCLRCFVSDFFNLNDLLKCYHWKCTSCYQNRFFLHLLWLLFINQNCVDTVISTLNSVGWYFTIQLRTHPWLQHLTGWCYEELLSKHTQNNASIIEFLYNAFKKSHLNYFFSFTKKSIFLIKKTSYAILPEKHTYIFFKPFQGGCLSESICRDKKMPILLFCLLNVQLELSPFLAIFSEWI